MSDLGNKKVFSYNLKRYMELNNLSRSYMANAVGVAYTTFNDWYNAVTYPRIDKIEKLARIFGIQKSALIEEHSDKDLFTPVPGSSPKRRFLMDKLAKASEADVEKLAKIWELVDSENE